MENKLMNLFNQFREAVRIYHETPDREQWEKVIELNELIKRAERGK